MNQSKIISKMQNAESSSWLIDEVGEEEMMAGAYLVSIAVSIQLLRRKQGLSQQQLADKLGVSQALVSRWENAEDNLTAHTLARIATALGTELKPPFECSISA